MLCSQATVIWGKVYNIREGGRVDKTERLLKNLLEETGESSRYSIWYFLLGFSNCFHLESGRCFINGTFKPSEFM